MPPIFSIVGRKNSGKTTLMEALIAGFRSRSIAVATIKHDAHAFEIDHEGTDSYRHRHAGSIGTAIVSTDCMALVRDNDGTLDVAAVAAFLGPADLILTEGYKAGDYPKIEVWRAATGQAPLGDSITNRIAFYSPDPMESDLPIFRPAQLEELIDFLVNRMNEPTDRCNRKR